MSDHADTAVEFRFEVEKLRNLSDDDMAPVSVDLLRSTAVALEALTSVEAERKIAAYDDARAKIKVEGGTRAFYMLRAMAVEEENERLRFALRSLLDLAAVSYEGDPWYAENAGIDGETVIEKAKSLLFPDE